MMTGMTITGNDHRDVSTGKYIHKYSERPQHGLAHTLAATADRLTAYQETRKLVDGLHEPVSDLHAGVLDRHEATLRLRTQLSHLSNGAADEHIAAIFEAAEYERKAQGAAATGELSDLEAACGENAYDDFRGHSSGWIKDNPELFEEEWRTSVLDEASGGELHAREAAAQAEIDARNGHRV